MCTKLKNMYFLVATDNGPYKYYSGYKGRIWTKDITEARTFSSEQEVLSFKEENCYYSSCIIPMSEEEAYMIEIMDS